MRVIFIMICMSFAALGAYYGQPYIDNNSDAIVVIITVLSVFAGFLVAIVTIVGDPSMIPAGSWRTAEVRRDTVEAGLIRHVWLFFVYMIAIALLFCGILLLNAPLHTCLKTWFERAYLFVGLFAFFLTFALPLMLLRMQMARLETEIQRRRHTSGINDPDTN